MPDFEICPVEAGDRESIAAFTAEHWGAEFVVAHNTVMWPAELPGLIAHRHGEWLGLITYRIEGNQCEVVSIDSLRPASGIGTALIEAVKQVALQKRCRRLWLITTNDNLDALRFYQRRGFVLAALYPNAIEQSRKVKPSIPEIGDYGIPMRDEIELEMVLGS